MSENITLFIGELPVHTQRKIKAALAEGKGIDLASKDGDHPVVVLASFTPGTGESLSRDALERMESLAYHKFSVLRSEAEAAHREYTRIADRYNDLKIADSS